MTERFDFRDMLGGAGASVENDASLADGGDADHAPGLCGHMLEKVDGMPILVEQLARSIVWTANANGICAGGVTGLVVARLAELALREVSEVQQLHFIAEVQTALDRVKI